MWKSVIAAQVVLAQGCERQIGGGDHGADTGEGAGRCGVNGLDAGVSMGAAEDAAVQQAGQVQIGAVLRATGNLVQAVGTHGPLADDGVLHFGKHLIGGRGHLGFTSQSVIGHWGGSRFRGKSSYGRSKM